MPDHVGPSAHGQSLHAMSPHAGVLVCQRRIEDRSDSAGLVACSAIHEGRDGLAAHLRIFVAAHRHEMVDRRFIHWRFRGGCKLICATRPHVRLVAVNAGVVRGRALLSPGTSTLHLPKYPHLLREGGRRICRAVVTKYEVGLGTK